MERRARLVHPHACVPPVVLLTMPQSRSKRAGLSLRVKCRLNRRKQSGVAEWLAQAFDGTLFEQPWTHSFISLSGDEDDGNLSPAAGQLPLEIRSGHAWGHGDIEDKTSGLIDGIGCKERLRRGKRLSRIPKLPHQVGQRLAQGLIVIDHRHQWTPDHHRLFTPHDASMLALMERVNCTLVSV